MDIRKLPRKEQIEVFEHLIFLDKRSRDIYFKIFYEEENLEKAKKPIYSPSLVLHIIITIIVLWIVLHVWLHMFYTEETSNDFTLKSTIIPILSVVIVSAIIYILNYCKFLSKKPRLENERSAKIDLHKSTLDSFKMDSENILKEKSFYFKEYYIPLDCDSNSAFEFILDKLKNTNLNINEIFEMYSKQKFLNEMKSEIMEVINEVKEVQKENERISKADAERRKAQEDRMTGILTDIRDTQNRIERHNKYGY